MMSTGRIFYIDTIKDRVAGDEKSPVTTTSNGTFNIAIPPNSGFDKVCLLSAVIPKSYYLVQQGYNRFDILEGNEQIRFDVPPGNYTYSTFRTWLEGALNANTRLGLSYTVTVPNTVTGEASTAKYTITATGAGSNIIALACPTSSKVHEQLGFNQDFCTFQDMGGGNRKLVSVNAVKFQAEDMLYLHSSLVVGGDDILQEIVVAGNDFSNIRYQNMGSIREYSKPLATSNTNTMTLTLNDESGRIIELNGLNMTIAIYLYKDTVEATSKMQSDYIKYSILASRRS